MVKTKLCPRCKGIHILFRRKMCEKCLLIKNGVSLRNSFYDSEKKETLDLPIIGLKVKPTNEKKTLKEGSTGGWPKYLTPENIEKLRSVLED